MPLGNWDDNRDLFFIQKPALSADMDSLAENDHRLLSQGYLIPFPFYNGMRAVNAATPDAAVFTEVQGPMAATGGVKLVDVNGSDVGNYQYIVCEVTFFIRDGAAYDTARFRIYVHDMESSGPAVSAITLYSREQDAPRTRVQEFQLLATSFTAAGWYGTDIDISGVTTGTHKTLVLEIRGGKGQQIEAGSAYVELVNDLIA